MPESILWLKCIRDCYLTRILPRREKQLRAQIKNNPPGIQSSVTCSPANGK